MICLASSWWNSYASCPASSPARRFFARFLTNSPVFRIRRSSAVSVNGLSMRGSYGCCIVFSPNYCGKYKEGFDPRTFLYKEEELLYLRCKKKNMKIVYNPKLTIRHLEDVSTNSMKYTRRKKIMFWLKNQIDSLEILVGELKQEEKNGIGNNSCL